MPTDCLFREDSYLKECSATVLGLTEAGGILLDRTVFYAASGGQPADHGVLTTATGDAILIDNVTFTDAGKTEIVHLPADHRAEPQDRRARPCRHRLGAALCPHAHAHGAASSFCGAALPGDWRRRRRYRRP